MTSNERLAEAVARLEEVIAYGEKMYGITLPADFAKERARNGVAALVELFEEAFDAGAEVGRLSARSELIGDPDPTEGFA